MTLDEILRQLEDIDANIQRIEKNFGRIADIESSAISTGFSFDECVQAIYAIWDELPAINGWKPNISVYNSTEKSLMRFDAQEVGEPHAVVATEEEIDKAERTVADYSRRVRQQRIDLTRKRILQLADEVNLEVGHLKKKLTDTTSDYTNQHEIISRSVKEIDVLLGDAFKRPPRWGDLRRHIGFWMECDVRDIVEHDWPAVYPVLTKQLYTEDEPIKVAINDLSSLVSDGDDTPVTTELSWDQLDADAFERLIYNLIIDVSGYQNPQWLMRTNAPDRGRDLSVERVIEDPLSGAFTQRVIIQCKHWRKKSVSVEEVATLKEQVKLWEPPSVAVVIIATSGRFTVDAVSAIERHNQSEQSPRIEMWPESHLEMLLARRPSVTATFRLRG